MLFPSVYSHDPPCKPAYLAIAQHVLAEATTAAVAPAAASTAASAAATTVLATVRRRDRRVPAQAPRLRLLRRDIGKEAADVYTL